MNLPKKIITMAGSARSIDASLMPEALNENIYSEDIFSLNYDLLLATRNFAKMDVCVGSMLTTFSNLFLYTLLSTPLSSVEKVTNHSILMFTLNKNDSPILSKFFNSASIQARKIKSDQKSMLHLIREMARNDITTAQIISGLTIDELIKLANQSNAGISNTIVENNFVYSYRGEESALLQSFKMPESTNAKMISLSKLLLNNQQTEQ